MVVILVLPTSINEERCKEVRSTSPLGFPLIIGAKSTMTTTIVYAVDIVIISGEGAENFFGCKPVSSSAMLMGLLIVGGLCRVQIITQN